jgi:hypothetical protein
MSFMLVLTTIVFLETIFLKLLIQVQDSPLCVQKLSNFLSTNSVLKYFIVAPFETIAVEGELNEVAAEIEHEPSVETFKIPENPKCNWNIFCRFVDRALFAVLIIFYAKYDGY